MASIADPGDSMSALPGESSRVGAGIFSAARAAALSLHSLGRSGERTCRGSYAARIALGVAERLPRDSGETRARIRRDDIRVVPRSAESIDAFLARQARARRGRRDVGSRARNSGVPRHLLAVKLTSRGSALYSCERVGRNGRPFRCLKFRTMVADADKSLQSHLARILCAHGGIRTTLQAVSRPASHASRTSPAADQPRRASPVLECADRRHERRGVAADRVRRGPPLRRCLSGSSRRFGPVSRGSGKYRAETTSRTTSAFGSTSSTGRVRACGPTSRSSWRTVAQQLRWWDNGAY